MNNIAYCIKSKKNLCDYLEHALEMNVYSSGLSL